MSAFIVNKVTIDTLVTLWRMRAEQTTDNTPTDAACEHVGRMLWTENHASVNYRYGETNDTSEIDAYTFTLVAIPSLVDVDVASRALGIIGCYEYQSCEHNRVWKESGSHAVCASLVAWIKSISPEAKSNGWEATGEDFEPEIEPEPEKPTDPIGVFFASLPTPLDARSVSCNEIRKRIRAELALAVEQGAIRTGTEFSVRGDHNSITVDVTAWEGPVLHPSYETHLMDPTGTPFNEDAIRQERIMNGRGGRGFDARYSEELADSLDVIHRIAGRHNYDNSDLQTDYFDVGYYLTVSARTVMAARERGIQLESNKAFAELARKAHICARVLPPNAVKAELGRGGFDTANEWALSALIGLAIRTGCVAYLVDGKPAKYTRGPIVGEVVPVEHPPKVAYDKRRRGWYAA